MPLLLIGLRATLLLALVTLLASTIIGIVLGTLATLRPPLVRILAAFYVEVFRDIPLIVTIFTIFFGAPLLGTPL
jgi:polar amino acid transport system permease protein